MFHFQASPLAKSWLTSSCQSLIKFIFILYFNKNIKEIKHKSVTSLLIFYKVTALLKKKENKFLTLFNFLFQSFSQYEKERLLHQ